MGNNQTTDSLLLYNANTTNSKSPRRRNNSLIIESDDSPEYTEVDGKIVPINLKTERELEEERLSKLASSWFKLAGLDE